LDPKAKTWFFRHCVDGKRKAERIGSKKEYSTKTEAKRAADRLRVQINPKPEAAPLLFASSTVAERVIGQLLPRSIT
jgi:hypothetical protein